MVGDFILIVQNLSLTFWPETVRIVFKDNYILS